MLRLSLALLALLLVVPAANAQATFPDGSAFGDGWRLSESGSSDVTQWPAFASMEGAVYLGPDGSRAMVAVIVAAEGAVEDRSAWTLANGMLLEYRDRITAAPGSDELVQDVGGCGNLQRLEGTDAVLPSVPVGMSLCESGQSIVLAYMSGSLGGVMGKAASDRVVEVVLAG